MRTLSLYELSQEEAQIEDAIIEGGGELTPELEEALNTVSTAIEKKMDACFHVLCHIDDVLPAAKKRRDELSKMIRAAENGKKRIKESWLAYMTQRNITKMAAAQCTVSIRNNPEKVNVDEDKVIGSYGVFRDKWSQDLPPYIKIKFEIDKEALKQCIDDGKPVPEGACTVKEQSVIFRRKL